MERSIIFNGYINYKWSFSIAMFVYQRVPLFKQDPQSLPQLYNSLIQQLFVNLTTQQQRVSTFQSLAQSNTAADLIVWYTLRFLCMSLTVHCIFYTVD